MDVTQSQTIGTPVTKAEALQLLTQLEYPVSLRTLDRRIACGDIRTERFRNGRVRLNRADVEALAKPIETTAPSADAPEPAEGAALSSPDA